MKGYEAQISAIAITNNSTVLAIHISFSNSRPWKLLLPPVGREAEEVGGGNP